MRPGIRRLGLFVAELTRRKVVRTAIVYTLGGVALIEATDAIVGVFGFPDSVLRIVAALTLLGLPIVLLLSWAYDITPEGLRPADEAEDVASGAAPQPLENSQFARSSWSPRVSARGRLAAGIAVVGAVVLAIASFSRLRPTPVDDPLAWGSSHYVDSIAVLVLDNFTNDPTFDAFAIGITEEIIRELAQIRGLKVISRHSVEAVRDAGLTARRLADSLQVRHVVEGSIQLQRDNQIRAVIQHIDARTDAHLWAKTFTASLDDPIVAQETIAEAVTSDVLAAIPGVSKHEHVEGTLGGAGQQLHQLGVHWLARRTPEGMRRAIDLLNGSIQQDAEFATAWADLSSAYALSLTYRYNVGIDGYTLAGRALAAAERAVRLAPTLADAYAARGYLKAIVDAPIDEIAADFQQAARLKPNAPSVPSWSARLLAATGRDADAITAARRAVDLDPLSAGRHIAVAYLSLHLGRFDEAIDAARLASTLEPELYLSRAIEGRALLLAGRPLECAALALGPHAVLRATCLAADRRASEAAAIVDSVMQTLTSDARTDDAFTDVVRFEDLAVYHAWQGDALQALLWIERAYAASPAGIEVRVLESALFDRIRGEPSFVRSVERMRREIWSTVQRAARQAERNAQTVRT